MFEPKHLKLWTMPDHYAGEVWPGYYVAIGQHRDSDALVRANFKAMLKAIGGESETVEVIREGHWAVGWVEWIGIHQDDEKALQVADEIAGKLKDYPVIDDDAFSAEEDEEAQETWRNCYSDQERLKYIREHKSQFDFNSLTDILSQVRGRYFRGYASELIH